MKNITTILMIGSIIILGLFLSGCKDIIEEKPFANNETQNGNEDDDMEGVDIYDFYFINHAPETTEKHSLDEVIKFYFSGEIEPVAIDVQHDEVYVEPLWSTNGIDSFEEPVTLTDKTSFLDILKQHNVQSWKTDYTTEHPSTYEDGYGWMLLIQFEDGTVESHRGSGSERNNIIPENFDDFMADLQQFMQEQLESSESTREN